MEYAMKYATFVLVACVFNVLLPRAASIAQETRSVRKGDHVRVTARQYFRDAQAISSSLAKEFTGTVDSLDAAILILIPDDCGSSIGFPLRFVVRIEKVPPAVVETSHGFSLNGARPHGFRIGLAATRYDFGYDLGIRSEGTLLTPSLDVTYLGAAGFGVSASASYLKEEAAYSFFGFAARLGVAYRVPRTFVLLKAGWSHFGGADGDGGTEKGSGPYLGGSTILRLNDHIGIWGEAAVHFWADAQNDRPTGWSISIGMAILPKL